MALIVLYTLFGLFQPRAGTSIVFVTERIARPICNVFRRRLPMIGPFDLSPAAAILMLMVLRLLLLWVSYKLMGGA